MENLRIKITGCVQRVGFRYSAVEMASRHNIRGFIMNMHDGSVRLEAEGEPHDLEAFVSWCRKGPQGARVDFLECIPGDVQGHTSFEIRH